MASRRYAADSFEHAAAVLKKKTAACKPVLFPLNY
jgi:hypothetical protein